MRVLLIRQQEGHCSSELGLFSPESPEMEGLGLGDGRERGCWSGARGAQGAAICSCKLCL